MNEGRGRNRKGTLYRRWKGKKYAIDDPEAKGHGTLWLRYTVAGKKIEASLGTADIATAKKQQDAMMRPLELASAKEALMQIEVRLKQTQTSSRGGLLWPLLTPAHPSAGLTDGVAVRADVQVSQNKTCGFPLCGLDLPHEIPGVSVHGRLSRTVGLLSSFCLFRPSFV